MNPLSLTHQDFCEAIQKKFSRGKSHASLLYREWWRSGTLLGHDPAFANAQNLLQDIQAEVPIELPLSLVKDQGESDARKLIFRTQNNLEIESVLIQMKGGSTLCVSSQVGCKMACAFCETGRMGLLKNLTAAEICAQVWMVRHQLKATVRNVVFMGMGEPFDNYDEVLKAVEILSDPFGGGIGPRRITISTVGCIDGILRLIEERRQVNLALSLNAPNDILRNKLMPINRTYSLDKILETIALYNEKTGRQVLVAYVLMDGVNDSLAHAEELALLLKGLNIKINLIPYNAQSRDRFQTPSEETIKSFRLHLENQGYPVLLRKTKGAKQMSACGQLGNMNLRRQLRDRPESGKLFLETPAIEIKGGVPMSQKNNSAILTKPEVNVTGRHVMVTQAMKDYARDKILKLERFGLRIWDINVLMDIQKVQHIVKIEFKVNGFPLKSTAVSEDMYASIDGAIDKVQAQLRRYKSRLTDHHAKGRKEIEMRVQILAKESDLSEINDEIDEENARRLDNTVKPHAVVQVESRTLNELSKDEAIMKMELSEDLFLVYRSEEDKKLHVIYRRNDGNYGIIETGV